MDFDREAIRATVFDEGWTDVSTTLLPKGIDSLASEFRRLAFREKFVAVHARQNPIESALHDVQKLPHAGGTK